MRSIGSLYLKWTRCLTSRSIARATFGLRICLLIGNIDRLGAYPTSISVSVEELESDVMTATPRCCYWSFKSDYPSLSALGLNGTLDLTRLHSFLLLFASTKLLSIWRGLIGLPQRAFALLSRTLRRCPDVSRLLKGLHIRVEGSPLCYYISGVGCPIRLDVNLRELGV